jgi:hypothetical protein
MFSPFMATSRLFLLVFCFLHSFFIKRPMLHVAVPAWRGATTAAAV